MSVHLQIHPVDQGSTTGLLASTKRRTVRPQPLGAPEPVEGRRHMDIQTDAYLEELTDIVPEEDATTQTEAFLDRPPTPLFMPQKSGLDVETQIEAGDLFDFDFEVEPLLEVLVGKVLEQGLLEVQEEEELSAMRAHQEHFEQIRNAELAATQRLEEAERRKLAEKERRLRQERQRMLRERAVREKVAACAFARGYLGGVLGTAFEELKAEGVFFDATEKELEDVFMPWLFEEATTHLAAESTARSAMHAIVMQAVQTLAAQKQAAEQRRLDEEARLIAEAAARVEAARQQRAREEHFLAFHAQWIQDNKASFQDAEGKDFAPAEKLAAARVELEAEAVQAAEAATQLARDAAVAEARELVLAEARAALPGKEAEKAPEEGGGEEGAAEDAAEDAAEPELNMEDEELVARLEAAATAASEGVEAVVANEVDVGQCMRRVLNPKVAAPVAAVEGGEEVVEPSAEEMEAKAAAEEEARAVLEELRVAMLGELKAHEETAEVYVKWLGTEEEVPEWNPDEASVPPEPVEEEEGAEGEEAAAAE